MWKCIFSLWAFAAYASDPVEAILTDIEGTTTSISFIHDVLFPYAKKNLRDYTELQ
jgi:methionine salvage enolase-phosphatase E1